MATKKKTPAEPAEPTNLFSRLARSIGRHSTVEPGDVIAVLTGAKSDDTIKMRVNWAIDAIDGDDNNDGAPGLDGDDIALVLPYLNELRERLITEAPWKSHAFDRLIASIGW